MLGVYSIYDVKAAAFMRPFFAETDGLAKRAIISALLDPNHVFAVHPADFTLFGIGEFDEDAGTLSPFGVRVNLGTCLELGEEHQRRNMARNGSAAVAVGGEV